MAKNELTIENVEGDVNLGKSPEENVDSIINIIEPLANSNHCKQLISSHSNF